MIFCRYASSVPRLATISRVKKDHLPILPGFSVLPSSCKVLPCIHYHPFTSIYIGYGKRGTPPANGNRWSTSRVRLGRSFDFQGLDGARPGMVEGLASGWLALQDLSEARVRCFFCLDKLVHFKELVKQTTQGPIYLALRYSIRFDSHCNLHNIVPNRSLTVLPMVDIRNCEVTRNWFWQLSLQAARSKFKMLLSKSKCPFAFLYL